MPTWTPWSAEDEDLNRPAITVERVVTETLTDLQLRELLEQKIGADLDPPSVDQASLKFREFSSEDVTIQETLRRTRLFCKRFSKGK